MGRQALAEDGMRPPIQSLADRKEGEVALRNGSNQNTPAS